MNAEVKILKDIMKKLHPENADGHLYHKLKGEGELIFKYDEIADHFFNWLDKELNIDAEWVQKNYQDLHWLCFDFDSYKSYISDRDDALKWLGRNICDCIHYLHQREEEEERASQKGEWSGRYYIDPTDPVDIVNHYVNQIGKIVVKQYYRFIELRDTPYSHLI